LPAPLLGGAILAASAGVGAVGGLPRHVPHWSVDVDALDLAIYETFAASGWRLPDISGARLGAVKVAPAGITLSWNTEASRPGGDAAEVTGMGAQRPLAEADGLLARGDTPAALSAYRAAARKGEAAPEAARRVLEVLLASAETLDAAA